MPERAPRRLPETDRVERDIDWSGDDLSDHTAEAVTYVRADLAEAESHAGTVFTDCIFRDCTFNAAAFTAAAFLNCTFTGCDFFAVRLTECKFVGSTFDRCDFAQLVVEGGDWSLVGLVRADLRRATLRTVRMREADLGGALCDGATLRDLDLAEANTGKASFAGADLRGTDLSPVDPWSANLARTVIDWQQAVTIARNLGLDVRGDTE